MHQVNVPNNFFSLKTLKKERFVIAGVTTISLFLSFIHCPLFNIFYDDKEIFKYAGLLISKGSVPYRDFFDHKPPLIFFINYFGLSLGAWGLWILDTVLTLISTLFFLRKCIDNKITFPWLLPILFNLLLRNNIISYGIGMTREYTAIFLLLFFCIAIGTLKYKYFFLGLLSALIFFTQQEQILPLAPFLFYAVFAGTTHFYYDALKRMTMICAGFLIIVIPLLSYFILHHSLKYFWEDAFLFNFNWYTEKKSVAEHARAITQILQKSGYDLTLYVSVILCFISLYVGNRKKILLITCLFAIAFSFSAELLSGKLIAGLSVEYYLLPLSATLPISLFTVFAFSRDLFLLHKLNQLIYGILLIFNPFFILLRYTIHLHPGNKNPVEISSEFQYLKKQNPQDYQLYIFYNSDAIYMYNQFKILSPSPWIYHYFWHWYNTWDSDNKKLDAITLDLQKHKTNFILDYSDENSFKDKDNYEFWKSFLKNKYTLVPMESSNTVLWKLK